MDNLDSDQANNDLREAVEVIYAVNNLYCDIEEILASDQTLENKLAAIKVKNREIGKLTAEWI